jgi:gliding motility-associated-like protein
MVEDASGCRSSLNIIVPVISNLSVDAGNDITICEGKGGSLSASSNGDSFSWYPSATLSQAASLNPVATPVSTTKYYLTATWGICSKTDSAIVFVSPAPIANVGLDTSTCYGKSIQLRGSGGVDYLWSPDTYLDNNLVPDPTMIKPINTVMYSLIVTDINNCKSILPANVTVTVTPPAKVFAGNDTSIIMNQALPLYAFDVNNSGFNNYLWSPASGLSNPNSQDPTAYITNDITYTVTAATQEGCEGEGSISIKVYTVSDIYVPNAFTPNGDGRNDILRAIPIGIKEFRLFVVYNRWGQLVFTTKNQSMGWDGTINGRLQDTGTYVWMTEGIDYKGNVIQRKGTVILIR